MNCPNCGVKAGRSDTRCRACGAVLQQQPDPFASSDPGLRFGPSARGAADYLSANRPPVSLGGGSGDPAASGLRFGKHGGSSDAGAEIRISGRPAPAPGPAFPTAPEPAFAGCAPPEPAAEPSSPRGAEPGKPSRRGKRPKQSPAVTALVVFLAVVLLAAAVYLPYRFLYLPYMENVSLTRTELLERYLKAVMERDPKTAFKYTPFAGDKELYEVYTENILSGDGGKTKRELKNTYGKYTVEVEIEQTKEYSRETTDALLTAFAMNYRYGDRKLSDVLNTAAIAEIAQVKGTVSIKGRKGSDSWPFTATLMKYDGRWTVLDTSMTTSFDQIDVSSLNP